MTQWPGLTALLPGLVTVAITGRELVTVIPKSVSDHALGCQGGLRVGSARMLPAGFADDFGVLQPRLDLGRNLVALLEIRAQRWDVGWAIAACPTEVDVGRAIAAYLAGFPSTCMGTLDEVALLGDRNWI